MKYADLHLHTNFSDGTFSPTELLEAARRVGLAAISIVDHDTVGAIPEALKAAEQLEIEVIPGIELTAEYEGTEVHMLGYFFDHTNSALLTRLNLLKNARVERIHKMVEKLNAIDVPVNSQDVFDLAGKGTVGRLHMARALLKKGLVSSIYEAFQKYIGEKCPGYVLGFRFSPQDAIKLIKESGGIPVLAHPYVLRNDNLIPIFVRQGLRGIEAYYSEHTPSMTDTYLHLAAKYNLLVTGGSDCHGAAKPDVKIGSLKLPYEFVEKLKADKK